MFLKHKGVGDLVEVLDVKGLVDPFQTKVAGRYHAGEEMQEPANFDKADLLFPSGESLPKCWVDPDYRT